ncbi:MAG: HNH endonuclease [Euryarchaeota archaeon]|nr:HNH endonuclease [Euryarchaeota archaeon]
MLRRDPKARLVTKRIPFVGGNYAYMFECGKIFRKISNIEGDKILEDSEQRAVLVASYEGRTWWLLKGAFFVTSELLTADEATVLIVERLLKAQRRIDRAAAYVATQGEPAEKREPIPQAVKEVVWTRDHGRCVQCGSQERIEFDHIIPLSKGGANTARNLQLLCEGCNREKGANIA